MMTQKSSREDYAAQMQILDLIAEYACIVSSRDISRYESLKSMYAPGGKFEGLRTFCVDTQFDEYVEYLVSLEHGEIPSLRQFIGISRISVEQDVAFAVTPVLLITTCRDEGSKIFAAGELHDSLSLVSNRWKFTNRRAVID